MIDERTGEKRFRSFAKEVRAYVGDGGGDIGREMGGGEKYFRTRRRQRKRAITEKTTGTSHISGQPARTGAHWRPMVAEEETQPSPARAMRATTHVVAHTWQAFSGISFCFRKRYLFDPTSTMAGGGDDFDDDFQPDELVALSDDEAGEGVDLEDVGHNAEGADEEDDQDPTPNDRSVEDKKRKRKEKMKEKKAKVRGVCACFASNRVTLRAEAQAH